MLQLAIASGGLREVEDALRPLAVQRAGRSDVYLKLLVDVFVASVRALRWSEVPTSVRRERLTELGDRALRPLLEALSGTDVALRARALEVLQSTRPPGAVPSLARLASAPTTVARVSVAVALGAIGTSSAVRALERLFQDGTTDTQQVAIWALGLADSAEAGVALREVAKARQTYHRILAAWAIGARADAEAIPLLQASAKAPDPRLRVAALWALARIGTPATTAALGGALRSANPTERRVAAWGLARIGTEAALRLLVDQLWTQSRHPNGDIASALASRGRDARDPEVASAYRSMFDATRGRLNQKFTLLLAATPLETPAPAQRLDAVSELMPLLHRRVSAVFAPGHRASLRRLLTSCLGRAGTLALAPFFSDALDPARARQLATTLLVPHQAALLELTVGQAGPEFQADALKLLSRLGGAVDQAQ
ncbi:MAG: HEAT repeat domain-containing protein, partial [Myxococcota bacterium]|nr:HEAT repeat domain-containing protein [Myxococcota bacterium]